MTPVKQVRPATDEDSVRGRGYRPRWREPMDEVIKLLDVGKDAVVEFELEDGERSQGVQSAIISHLIRRSQLVKIEKLKPKDGQPENEIGFRISRKERE